VSVLSVQAAQADPSAKQNYLQDCSECHRADGKAAQPEKRTLRVHFG
jgi:hypothetical protein